MVYRDLNMYIIRASVDLRVSGEENTQEAFNKLTGLSLNDGAATAMVECYFFGDGTSNLVGFTMTRIDEEV